MKHCQIHTNATFTSILIAFILVAIHIPVYFLTDSLMVFSSMIESFSDFFISFFAFILYRLHIESSHDKYENLGSKFLLLLVIISIIFVIFEAINNLFSPPEIQNTFLVYLLGGISCIITLYLLKIQKNALAHKHSKIIQSDHIHYHNDMLQNIVMIIGISLYDIFNIQWIDPILSLVICFYILYHIYKELNEKTTK